MLLLPSITDLLQDITAAATTRMMSLRESVTGVVDQETVHLLPQARDSRMRVADARLMKATPVVAAHQLTAGQRLTATPATKTLSERDNALLLLTRVAATVGTVQGPRPLSDRRAAIAITVMRKGTFHRHRFEKALLHHLEATSLETKTDVALAMSDHLRRWDNAREAIAAQGRHLMATWMGVRHRHPS